jgi:16S rRNA (uracil1498-N3)-methyltransferase
VVVADLSEPHLDDDDARHLGAVLRLRPGELVSTTDGRGGLRFCHYAVGGTLDPVDDVVASEPAGIPVVTVALTPVKGDRTEWAVQKLTEIGVERIVLMKTERSVVRWDDRRAVGHIARLHKVARAAVMQSRGLWLPEITGMFDFADVAVGQSVLADPDGGPPDLDHPTVLIGPEGGWSPDEEQVGLPKVRLGPGVMRAETAAVAAGVLMMALRGGIVGPGAAPVGAGRLEPRA